MIIQTSQGKKYILNKLKDLYLQRQLHYLNLSYDDRQTDELVNTSLENEINELERRLNAQHEVSGIFTSQKNFLKMLTFLEQLHAGNNSKKLKNKINQLLKALYESKQITKQVYNNIIKAITYKNDS